MFFIKDKNEVFLILRSGIYQLGVFRDKDSISVLRLGS